MTSTESILFWAAAVALASGFFLALAAMIFPKKSLFRGSLVASLLALGLLSALGIMRWLSVDHPPFVSRFESMIISIWFMLTLFHFSRLFNRKIEILSMPLSLIGFMLLGWASSLETAASPLSTALENSWLFIHASFATSGAGAFLITASYGTIYLMGPERLANLSRVSKQVPEHASLPKASLNFLIFGLILWGVMIVSGSIWANAAWGRYWAWDPIELWSLISWMLYGLVLHTRLTFRISHRTFSWLTIIAAATILFALWGVGYIYETIHSYG